MEIFAIIFISYVFINPLKSLFKNAQKQRGLSDRDDLDESRNQTLETERAASYLTQSFLEDESDCARDLRYTEAASMSLHARASSDNKSPGALDREEMHLIERPHTKSCWSSTSPKLSVMKPLDLPLINSETNFWDEPSNRPHSSKPSSTTSSLSKNKQFVYKNPRSAFVISEIFKPKF